MDLNTSKIFDLEYTLPIAHVTLAKLLLLSGSAGVAIKGRVVLANSFIVDAEYFDDDELKAIESFAKCGLLTFKKVTLPDRPRTKTLIKPEWSPLSNPASTRTLETNTSLVNDFEEFWVAYPARGGQKLRKQEAKTWYTNNINDSTTSRQLMTALANYKQSPSVIQGFVKDAINFLPDWTSWLNYDPRTADARRGQRPTQAQINRPDDDKIIL